MQDESMVAGRSLLTRVAIPSIRARLPKTDRLTSFEVVVRRAQRYRCVYLQERLAQGLNLFDESQLHFANPRLRRRRSLRELGVFA